MPFPLQDQVPPALRDVLLDFHWDAESLHALDLPVRFVATSELTWHLNLPFWSADGSPFQISPNEVASDPAKHPQQWHRTHAADLRHPLDAYLRGDGRVVILDGIHRLLKAFLLQRPHMDVRILPPDRFDAIAVARLPT
ncbi:hypothetical protein [Ornithinimicrobium sufpigmenti]|uniref:hypothetical protein n=1 Tax=Ornithinimicrobium sufpigmenti TaxID=2508882 RepID=UPI0010361650|nr:MULTISPECIES: hypothetical protein [unclassified Ornithinimicrobium]